MPVSDRDPTITVIVVNYNSGDRLKRCLDCLATQSFEDFETIVIDNGSSDNSILHARDAQIPVVIDEAGENLGFAAANNRAAKSARGEWLAFLNPDAYPEPGWLAALIAATKRYRDVDAFGSTQIDAANPKRLDGAGDRYFFAGIPFRSHHGAPIEKLPPEGECFAPCAAAAIYRRSAFDRLGGFEEKFFCYCEDVDLGFRLRLAGGKVMQIPAACVLHEGSGVTGENSAFTIYHGHRNRIWTWYRNMPLPLLILGAPVQFAINIYLLIRFAFIGRAGPYLRALRDGFGGIAEMAACRRDIQANRISGLSISGDLTWSPISLATKRSTTQQ